MGVPPKPNAVAKYIIVGKEKTQRDLKKWVTVDDSPRNKHIQRAPTSPSPRTDSLCSTQSWRRGKEARFKKKGRYNKAKCSTIVQKNRIKRNIQLKALPTRSRETTIWN